MRTWCEVCRGDADRETFNCTKCPRRFHRECLPQKCTSSAAKWVCSECTNGEERSSTDWRAAAKKCKAAVRKSHKRLKQCTAIFVQNERDSIVPFADAKILNKFSAGGRSAKHKEEGLAPITGDEEYIHATLREYQVAGVNWMISQYNIGVGGILADEMGLGKTVQTLSFINTLKEQGLPGPHLVVTPLAVLINWTNEIKSLLQG